MVVIVQLDGRTRRLGKDEQSQRMQASGVDVWMQLAHLKAASALSSAPKFAQAVRRRTAPGKTMGAVHSRPTRERELVLSSHKTAAASATTVRIALPDHIISDICGYLDGDHADRNTLLAIQQTATTGWFAASPFVYKTVRLRSSADFVSFLQLFNAADGNGPNSHRAARAEMSRWWVNTLIIEHWDPQALKGFTDVLARPPVAQNDSTVGLDATAEQASRHGEDRLPCFPNAHLLRLSRDALAGMIPDSGTSVTPRDIASLQASLHTLCSRVVELEHLCIDDVPSFPGLDCEDATFLDLLLPGLRYLGRVTRKCVAKSVTIHHDAGLSPSSFAVAGITTRLYFPAITRGADKELCSFKSVQLLFGSVAASLALWKRPFRWVFILPDTPENRTEVDRLGRSWNHAVLANVKASLRVAAWGAAVKHGDESLGEALFELLDEVEAAGLVSIRVQVPGEGCGVCRSWGSD